MEFINVKLSDIGEVVGGSTPSTKNPDNYDGDIAWITPKDLAGYNKVYISRGERNITEAGFKSCSTKMLPKNSVLFSSRAPIGYVAISENDLCTNQGFKSIIPNEKIDYKFLYYLLKHNKDYIASKGSGSTFKEVSGSVMKGIELSIPKEISDQRRISKVLFDIDKKIELNNEINNNLYKLIKNNYESLINGCNWEEVELGTISNITSGKRPVDKSETGEYPVIGANGIMAYTRDYNFNEDLIITGRVGTLGVVKRYLGKIWASDNTLVIQTKYLNYIGNYLKTIDYYSLNRGSTQPLLTQGDLKKQIICFNEELIAKFEKDNQIFVDKIRNNEKENSKLIQLRDALLPKLMNGEMDLDNIEI